MEPLTALLSLALAGSLAQGPQPEDTLTEEQFLASLADEAVVVAASLDVGERRAALAAAGLYGDPEVSLGVEDPGGDDQEIELSLGWQPPRPDRRRLELEAARAELEAAEAVRDREVALVRLEARESFAAWAVATERLRSLDVEADLLAEATRRVGERVRQGEASGLDHRRLRLASAEVDARRATARAEATQAAARAAIWAPEVIPTGESATAAAVAAVTPVLPDLPPVAVFSDALDTPTVRSLEAEIRAAEAELALADLRADLPTVLAGWKDVTGPDGSAGAPVVGLSWTIPIADRRSVRTERAENRLASLRARLDLARRRGEAGSHGVQLAYADLRQAADQADEAWELGPAATEAARLAFELGEADLTTLLDTVRAATAARVAAAELHGSALEVLRELERIRLVSSAPTTSTESGDMP